MNEEAEQLSPQEQQRLQERSNELERTLWSHLLLSTPEHREAWFRDLAEEDQKLVTHITQAIGGLIVGALGVLGHQPLIVHDPVIEQRAQRNEQKMVVAPVVRDILRNRH